MRRWLSSRLVCGTVPLCPRFHASSEEHKRTISGAREVGWSMDMDTTTRCVVGLDEEVRSSVAPVRRAAHAHECALTLPFDVRCLPQTEQELQLAAEVSERADGGWNVTLTDDAGACLSLGSVVQPVLSSLTLLMCVVV